MALSTYSDLQSAIASWIDREDVDFIARTPDFITLCEQRLNYGAGGEAGLRVADMEKTVTLTPDVNGSLTFPADYLESRAFSSNIPGYDAPYLTALDANAGRYPESGIPGAFTVVGNSVGTYPAANGAVTLTYYAKIPALSDSNPTNWLLTKASGVYLYGSLIESAPFESDDARMQTWLALYTSAIGGLKGSDTGARYANATSRVRGSRP